MFETLLSLIGAQGTISSADLARSLDVTDALLDDILEDLTRKGYLKVVVQGRTVACDRCPMHKACLYRRQVRIWMLSPKGGRLLSRRGKNRAN
jgi:Mn-dependent DtxR family transcriptional regulator